MWQVPMGSQYADDVSATAHPQIFHVTEWMTALGIFPKGTGWIEGRYQFSETSESQTSKLLCAPRPHFMRFHHSPYQIVLDLVVSVYFCIPLPLPLLTKLINMRAENTYLKSGFFVCVFFFLKALLRTSLVVHWLRLCAPNVGDTGSIPGQGTRSHSLQRRARRN